MSHHVRFAEPAWPDGSSPFRGCGDATAQAGVMLEEELRPPLLPVPLVAARTSDESSAKDAVRRGNRVHRRERGAQCPVDAAGGVVASLVLFLLTLAQHASRL